MAGFNASGEGWNGEYPFSHPWHDDKRRMQNNQHLETSFEQWWEAYAGK